MSYFTETFEGILEFKNSPDGRDARDKMSGDHNFSRAKKAMGKGAYNDMHTRGISDGKGEDVRNMKEKRDYDAAARTAKNSLNGKRSDLTAHSAAMYRDSKNGKYGSYGSRQAKRTDEETNKILSKVNKESYDPVYEDLCRMGIID